MPLEASRGQGQNGVQAIQRLDRSFFIHTKDGGVLRRSQIQADDVCRLGFEIRIVAGLAASSDFHFVA